VTDTALEEANVVSTEVLIRKDTSQDEVIIIDEGKNKKKSSNEDPQEEFNNEISKKLPAPVTVHESLINNIMD